MHDSVTVHMQATPDQVWALVSDVTRIGSYSPETFEAEWIDGATGPAVGAKFRGHVKRNGKGPIYWTTCVVSTCVPGSVFGFDVLTGGKALNTWTYRIEPSGDGSDVTESFRLADDLVPQAVLGAARLGPGQDQPQRHAGHPRGHQGGGRNSPPPERGGRRTVRSGREQFDAVAERVVDVPLGRARDVLGAPDRMAGRLEQRRTAPRGRTRPAPGGPSWPGGSRPRRRGGPAGRPRSNQHPPRTASSGGLGTRGMPRSPS